VRRGVRRTTAAFAVAALGMTGCAAAVADAPPTDQASAADGSLVDPVAAAEDRVLIDVRTDEEVAGGTIAGALHLDVQDPDFETQVAQLPRDEAYLVFCRSGNRSGQAIERMRELGFEDLVNGGAYEDLAAAGLPTDP
jgi:phage shock protein E